MSTEPTEDLIFCLPCGGNGRKHGRACQKCDGLGRRRLARAHPGAARTLELIRRHGRIAMKDLPQVAGTGEHPAVFYSPAYQLLHWDFLRREVRHGMVYLTAAPAPPAPGDVG